MTRSRAVNVALSVAGVVSGWFASDALGRGSLLSWLVGAAVAVAAAIAWLLSHR